MRAEKKLITTEYVARLNASPFFIVVDYTGLTVTHFNELRSRLRKGGASDNKVISALNHQCRVAFWAPHSRI